jgi:hypothetical protein
LVKFERDWEDYRILRIYSAHPQIPLILKSRSSFGVVKTYAGKMPVLQRFWLGFIYDITGVYVLETTESVVFEFLK